MKNLFKNTKFVFGVTDYKLVLPNPEEKAEATRIAQAQQRTIIANQLLQMGFDVELKDDKGQMKPFFVSKIDKKFIYLDGNHPLAGKKITFKIKILDVREATKEELEEKVFDLN